MEKHDVVLIDRDIDKVRQVSGSLDCMVIHGEANNREVLKQASIDEADYFIAVTQSDEFNMIACGVVASEYNVSYKIARVRSFDYTSSSITQKPFFGIDYIVNPEVEASKAVLRSVEHGAISDIINFEGTTYQMRTMVIGEGSRFLDKRIHEIKQDVQYDFIVAVIVRENGYIIPQGDTIIRAKDTLYLIGQKDVLQTAFETEGRPRAELRKIVIVGGGRIGTYVTKQLMMHSEKNTFLSRMLDTFVPHQKRQIVIIERDYNRSKQLAEEFSQALVIYGDVSEEGILEENGLMDYDLLISTTGNQELNLVTSMYAKSIGIKRSIALVNKNDFLKMASKLNIDTTISMNNALVNSILKLIRKGTVHSIHAVSGGNLEVVELSVQEGSRVANKRIRDLKLPYHSLLLFISRGDENYLPHGDDFLFPHDNVVLITRKENTGKLDQLFAKVKHGKK